MVWLDTLDLHMVNTFNGSFREEQETAQHAYDRPDDASVVEFASGVVPANHQPKHRSSPILNYKYSRTLDALRSMQSNEKADPHFGHMVKFLDPTTGDWAIPTLAAQMRLLPKGFESLPYRSTESTVFSVVEGSGTSVVGDDEFHWETGDTLIVPSWAEHKHRSNQDAVLFSISDRAAQEKLYLFREQR
jgi:gentisate 1,2-dioxygenase